VSRRPDIAELAELLAKVDPAGLPPDELPALSRSDRRALASLLIERINEIAAERPANRPADQDKHFFAALEIALRPANETIEHAKERIRRRWKFTPDQIKRAWLDHGKQAKDIARDQDHIGLVRVIQHHHVRLCRK